MAFLEERMSEQFSFGSSITESYSVVTTRASNGNTYKLLMHPYSVLTIDLDFNNKTGSWMYTYLIDLFQRSSGTFGGFRFKNPTDYSTNSLTGTPTFNDQIAVLSSTGVYQITNWYGPTSSASAARRKLKKLVADSVLVGIRDENGDPVQVNQYNTSVSPQTENWSVDTTTGLVTFSTNKSKVITGISKAAQAVITVGAHTYVAGETVHIKVPSGMTEIDGKRATIQGVAATTITVDIDSTSFTTFSSGSPQPEVNTRPQDGETVTAGCEYDIPVSFETDLTNVTFVTKSGQENILSAGVRLVELLNP